MQLQHYTFFEIYKFRSMVMDAAKKIGTHIPHFCYHKKLSIAANCRMCLVEVEKAPKPLPACATPVTPGMKVFTHSEKAVQAQKSVMEFLLINHPSSNTTGAKPKKTNYRRSLKRFMRNGLLTEITWLRLQWGNWWHLIRLYWLRLQRGWN